MNEKALEPVTFLTVEDGDDLIVSFAIDLGEGEVASLTLLRTPKYERFLAPDERGVSVSHEFYMDMENELLRRATFSNRRADLVGSGRSYALDISRVDRSELRSARTVLQRMNFDAAFQLRLGDLGM